MNSDTKNYNKVANIAIKRWNDTKLVKFYRTKNENKARVILDLKNKNDVVQGFTSYGPNVNPNSETVKYAYISVSIKAVNEYMLYNTDRATILEHEMGHALGLDHSRYIYSIMYPGYSYSEKPSKQDKRAVKSIYSSLPYEDKSLHVSHTTSFDPNYQD